MRRKIAIVLTFIMLNYSMNIFADTFSKNNSAEISDKFLGESVATPSETGGMKETEEQSEDIDEITDTIQSVDEEEKPEVVTGTPSMAVKVMEKDAIYNVSFPTNIHAQLDPGNLSGKGQIFSDTYEVENYGNTNISIKIKNIDVSYSSKTDMYELSENEITDSSSNVKKLNIDMVWENKSQGSKKVLHVLHRDLNECVISLQAAKYNENDELISLGDGGTGHFYFTGTMNSNPGIEWEDGEITVRFDYEIVNEEEALTEIFSAEDREDEKNSEEADRESYDSAGTGTS